MNISFIGLQWGDEGKGKIIDLITNFFDINIRSNGGHNAGHLIYLNKKKKKIRILPSGIFKKNCFCYISDNIMFSLENFFKEIKKNNIFLKKIGISKNCILINNLDELIDYLIDLNSKIGSTFNGITSGFLKKMIKCSIKIKVLFKFFFLKNIKKNIFYYNLFFFFFKIKIKINIVKFYYKNVFYILKIKKILLNNEKMVNNNYLKIFENSQGALLDIDCGTYPFVTCSNTINKSIFINSKFYLNKIKHIGLIKSYVTRVGNGFFISNFKKKKKKFFSKINNEIGTNSSRIRFTGWLDLTIIKYNIKLNNISNLIITKMDSLIFLKYIKIIFKYHINNKFYFDNINNIYYVFFFKFNSWKKTSLIYKNNEKYFHFYIRFIEKILNTPINIISIGKESLDVISL